MLMTNNLYLELSLYILLLLPLVFSPEDLDRSARSMGMKLSRPTQGAWQADGITTLPVVGEVHMMLAHDNHRLTLQHLGR